MPVDPMTASAGTEPQAGLAAAGRGAATLAAIAPGIFVVFWSSGFVAARYGMRDAGPLTFLAVRMVITFALLLVIAKVVHAPPIDRRTAGWTGLAALGLHGLYLGGVWIAIAWHLPAGIGAIFAGVHPILTAVGGRFLLREHLRRRQWLGVGLGVCGVAFVVVERLSGGKHEVSGSMLIAMAIGVVGMSAGTLTQRAKASGMPLVAGSLVQYGVSAIVFCAGAVLHEGIRWHTTASLLWTMAWSVGALSIGSTLLLMWLISRQAAARVSSLFFLTPALSMIEARVLFGEKLGPLALAGMAVALTGVALTTRG